MESAHYKKKSTCYICHQVYTYKSNLDIHIKKNHNKKNIMKTPFTMKRGKKAAESSDGQSSSEEEDSNDEEETSHDATRNRKRGPPIVRNPLFKSKRRK